MSKKKHITAEQEVKLLDWMRSNGERLTEERPSLLALASQAEEALGFRVTEHTAKKWKQLAGLEFKAAGAGGDLARFFEPIKKDIAVQQSSHQRLQESHSRLLGRVEALEETVTRGLRRIEELEGARVRELRRVGTEAPSTT